jgi:hypothetical protein
MGRCVRSAFCVKGESQTSVELMKENGCMLLSCLARVWASLCNGTGFAGKSVGGWQNTVVQHVGVGICLATCCQAAMQWLHARVVGTRMLHSVFC